MTTSGHFADTHRLTLHELNLTDSQIVVARSDTEKLLWNAQAAHGPVSPIPPWRSTRHFTEEADAHHCPNFLAEQHIYWQEQGRHALNFQQASFERAAQEYEQAARDEVHVALAQDTEMSGAEMRERLEAVENQAEQTWTAHQVAFF